MRLESHKEGGGAEYATMHQNFVKCVHLCMRVCVFDIWSLETQFVHCNTDILKQFFLTIKHYQYY